MKKGQKLCETINFRQKIETANFYSFKIITLLAKHKVLVVNPIIFWKKKTKTLENYKFQT